MGAGASLKLREQFENHNLSKEQELSILEYHKDLRSRNLEEQQIYDALSTRINEEISLKENNKNDESRMLSKVLKQRKKKLAAAAKLITSLKFDDKSVHSKRISERENLMQFHCEICQTSFRTYELLVRHEQYSYIHGRLLRDKEYRQKAAERSKQLIANSTLVSESVIKELVKATGRSELKKKEMSPATFKWQWAIKRVIVQNAVAMTKQYLMDKHRNISSTHSDKVRLLLHGSKFFWRLQETLDFHIFIHDDLESDLCKLVKSKVIEIVAYDMKENLELPRLYFNLSNLLTVVEESFIESVSNASKNNTDTMETKLAKYILARLSVEITPGKMIQKRIIIDSEMFKTKDAEHGDHPINKLMVSEYEIHQVLSLPKIDRKVGKTMSEVNSIMNLFEEDAKQAAVHRKTAEDHVEIVHNCLDPPVKRAKPKQESIIGKLDDLHHMKHVKAVLSEMIEQRIRDLQYISSSEDSDDDPSFMDDAKAEKELERWMERESVLNEQRRSSMTNFTSHIEIKNKRSQNMRTDKNRRKSMV